MLQTEQTYQVTFEDRVWTLRPLPKHFFLFAGNLPALIKDRPANAEAAVEAVKKLSPDEQVQMAVFARDAVTFACVNPKISMNPQNENEISPFDISEAEFEFLSQTVMQNVGAEKKS